MNDHYTYSLSEVTFQTLPEYPYLHSILRGKANKMALRKAGYPVQLFIVKTLLSSVFLDIHEWPLDTPSWCIEISNRLAKPCTWTQYYSERQILS